MNSIQLNSTELNSTELNSTQFNSNQSSSIQLNSIQFNSIQFDSIQFNSIEMNSIQLNSIQLQHCIPYKEGLFVVYTGALISPYPDQEGNKLQRQKILMFIYPIYNHNWRNISTIYIYITRLASNEIFSPSNKIHREVGRAKDLSAPLYIYIYNKTSNKRNILTIKQNTSGGGSG